MRRPYGEGRCRERSHSTNTLHVLYSIVCLRQVNNQDDQIALQWCRCAPPPPFSNVGKWSAQSSCLWCLNNNKNHLWEPFKLPSTSLHASDNVDAWAHTIVCAYAQKFLARKFTKAKVKQAARQAGRLAGRQTQWEIFIAVVVPCCVWIHYVRIQLVNHAVHVFV